MNLLFSSNALLACRPALEELLFFNPRQHKVRAGIVDSLEKYGHPKIEETATGLRVRIGDYEPQNLFAFDRDRRENAPVGIVLYLRTSAEEITILHMAVHPNYCQRAGMGLGITLVEKVREIAVRIVGIKRIAFFYRQEVVIRL